VEKKEEELMNQPFEEETIRFLGATESAELALDVYRRPLLYLGVAIGISAVGGLVAILLARAFGAYR
jgi:hypothetical protein